MDNHGHLAGVMITSFSQKLAFAVEIHVETIMCMTSQIILHGHSIQLNLGIHVGMEKHGITFTRVTSSAKEKCWPRNPRGTSDSPDRWAYGSELWRFDQCA